MSVVWLIKAVKHINAVVAPYDREREEFLRRENELQDQISEKETQIETTQRLLKEAIEFKAENELTVWGGGYDNNN